MGRYKNNKRGIKVVLGNMVKFNDVIDVIIEFKEEKRKNKKRKRNFKNE